MAPKGIQSHGWLYNVGNSFVIKKIGLGSKTSGLTHLQLTRWLSRACHSTYIWFFIRALESSLSKSVSSISPFLVLCFTCLPLFLYFGPLFPLIFLTNLSILKGLLSPSCLFFIEFSPHIVDFNCMFHNPETTVYSKLIKCGGEIPTVFFN